MGKTLIKIAIIEPVGGHGGMDFYDYGLAKGLGENNVDVHYFTSIQTAVRQYPNVTTHLSFNKVWDTSNKVLRLYFFLRGYIKSFKIVRKKKIKVVHLQFFDLSWLNFIVILLTSLFKFKKILTLHDVSSFKSKDKSFIEKFILNNFSHVIVHNELSYQELRKKIPNTQNIKIVPHGNYLPFVQKLPYHPKINEKLNLLFFGQIKKVKGLEILLEALSIAIKKNSNIHLTIAGKVWHDDLYKYNEQITVLGLQKFVTPHFEFVPNETVSGYFKEADVVVLPYKKIYQSGVLLLSMSYGRVALTSDLPAFKEIVEDENTGYLFKEGNPEDLAAVILKIAANRKQLKEINNRASQLLKTTYNWTSIGARTKQLYTSL